MQKQLILMCSLFILTLGFFLPATTSANISKTTSLQPSTTTRADFPTVDPNYIYDQLFFMATHFQRREAGYDHNLAVGTNGHDEFANYWAQEMVRNLQGFGTQVRRDEFTASGWRNRPTVVPAFNVEVSVPGATHPEQEVIIGCHYDGEAISTQSANDDTSGCAIELGVAKALGNYWRSHQAYPARTLRFVIFDAEEQGLLGSFHYLNSTVNGDVNNIMAMFNEEQNGIAYPLRYLGQMENPLLPFSIDMSPLTNTQLYPAQDKLSPEQREKITNFRALMQQAVPAVFQQFQALGYRGLTYHGNNKQEIAQPIFTPDQISNIYQEDDNLGGSDQIPFTLAGLPCATFAGNSTYYDPNPPAWSYPFDQAEDTIQMMNTFAQGSSKKSNALMLALALPGMLTTWMLNQPTILGQTAANVLPARTPLAAISDLGQTQVGQNLVLDAKTSFDPTATNITLTYSWNFGDGSKASGVTVNHTYTSAGNYTLTLTVSSAVGTYHVNKTITVATSTTVYQNPYERDQQDGRPPNNPQVVLPTPDDTLSDKVISSPVSVPTSAGPHPAIETPGVPLALLLGGSIAVLGGIGLMIILRRRRA